MSPNSKSYRKAARRVPACVSRKGFPAALCFALIFVPSLMSPSSSQTPATSLQKKTPADVDEFESRKLAAPMELPYLAEFPRKVFLQGRVKPNTANGPSYVLYFSVKQPPQEVLSWYESSLTANKWKIKQKMSHMIDAIHPEGHTCIVMTQFMPPVYDEGINKFRSETKLSIYFQTKWH